MSRRGAEGQPGLQPVKIVGDVKSHGATPDRLPEFETPIKGVKIIYPEGDFESHNIPLDRLVDLLEASRTYVVLYPLLAAVKAQMNQPEIDIRAAVKDFNIRGILEEDRFRLPVSYPESSTFDRDKLKAVAGDRYGDVVKTETVELSAILKPEWGVDPALLTTGFKLLLVMLGVPESQVSEVGRVSSSVKLDVNVSLLKKLHESNAISDPDEAVEVTKQTPRINKPTIYQRPNPSTNE